MSKANARRMGGMAIKTRKSTARSICGPDIYIAWVMCMGMGMGTCIDMCIDLCMGMRIGMCIDMCIDMCMGMHMGMCIRMCICMSIAHV